MRARAAARRSFLKAFDLAKWLLSKLCSKD